MSDNKKSSKPPGCEAPPKTGDFFALEKVILRKIDEANIEIGRLNEEKRAYSRMLLEARRQNLKRDVNRRNSVDRIIIETKIVEYLTSKNVYVNWKELFIYARQTIDDLNESTFRTYLHRLKAKEVINYNAKNNGWKMSDVGSRE